MAKELDLTGAARLFYVAVEHARSILNVFLLSLKCTGGLLTGHSDFI